MAHSFDKLYGARGFADARQLINSVVDWVSDDHRSGDGKSGRMARPVRVEGPTGLLCNLTERDHRRALHLVNYTGNINEHSVYKVDWVAPLVDIPVRLEQPQGRKLTGASLLSTGAAVPWKEEGDAVVMSLSVLDGYECLLLTYQ